MIKQILLLVALTANVPAQPQASAGSWANVSQLAPGTEIRVVRSKGSTLRGSLQRVTSDSLDINAATRQETLPRAEIRMVQLKRNGHRWRNTLIGLAIGGGGGLAIGAAVDHGNRSGWFPNAGKAIFAPLGAIIGAVVGVAIPAVGWREIYRAP